MTDLKKGHMICWQTDFETELLEVNPGNAWGKF